jgi:uncharacterized phage protein gp47/JayE
MGLTLEQLLTAPTKETIRNQLFNALQGVGFIHKDGFGSGGLSASGLVVVPMSVRVKIATTGDLGSATFQLSTDGGATYASAISVPLSGAYAVGSTGVTLQFSNGPTGGGSAFVSGDLYQLALTTPTFAATSWQPGSTPRTIIETDAALQEEYGATQRAIAAGGYLSTARGAWLDLVLTEVYGLTRIDGVSARGTVRITDAANAGPFSIAANQLWVGTIDGRRYNNTSGATLAMGGHVDVEFQAESPGSLYNVSVNSIVVMFTTLPGVTVTNPDIGGGTWLTRQGRNRETDAEAIARAQRRWPTLSTGITEDVYKQWAQETPTYGQNVTRVKVAASLTVEGTVNIYLAGAGGAVDGATVTAVNNYIQPKVTLTNLANVASAANHTLALVGTVYYYPGYSAVAPAQVAQNLSAYGAGGTDTSGEAFPGVPIGGSAYASELIEMVMKAAGVRNFVLTSPAIEQTDLAANEVLVLDITGLTYTQVT